MRTAICLMAAIFINLAAASLTLGAAHPPMATSPAEHPGQAKHSDPHPCPAISLQASWVRPTILGIAILFIAAIPVGMVIRANTPQHPPTDHAHDDSPHAPDHDAHGSHGTGEHH